MVIENIPEIHIKCNDYEESGTVVYNQARIFGFEDMTSRALCVEACIEEAEAPYHAVDDIAHCQDQAILETCGIESTSHSPPSEAESSYQSETSDSET